MNNYILKFIRGITIILSCYIISTDIFTIIVNFFYVSIFGDEALIWVRIFVYMLLMSNLLSMLSIFLLITVDKFIVYQKYAFIIIIFLFIITIAHLIIQIFDGSYEVLFTLYPLSIQTLLLLSVYGLYFLLSKK